MGGVRASLVGLVVVGGVGACSASLGGSKGDAGRDAAHRDGSVDLPSSDRMGDGSVAADRNDGSADGQDGGRRCSPLDLSAPCPVGDGTECQTTWTGALANPQCVTPEFAASFAAAERRVDCGGYHIRVIDHPEMTETYYYDIASGMLVAIYSGGITDPQGVCWGPPQGVAAGCSNVNITWTLVCTLYGGALSVTDAGLGADGGGPSCYSGTVLPNTPCARDGGTDAATPCYAACTLGGNDYKYVGCVSGEPGLTTCYSSCDRCP